MLNAYAWYVCTQKDENGCLFSFVERVQNCNELLSHFAGRQIISVNACDSKSEAKTLADFWNECYIKNGSAPKWMKNRMEV